MTEREDPLYRVPIPYPESPHEESAGQPAESLMNIAAAARFLPVDGPIDVYVNEDGEHY